ncbi:hypothetical protein [Methylobacterium gnaphalii]|uniref:Uncharacterized protein n=1 Tax=Methylobacterium gnaphalii TaxID=1010610 RepID=A0A512JP69_9HYPH|nr:hypothetical protein [Methylobacterium gnaphalii]GEP11756.1 hypothetical protein MGN01_36010 [Methylobacterium gnaphalii]GJD69434.1 hypothetical protein MMMDOFMJ_2365 [Methylobacterium gnaphalii]GLS49609.1 hypothetical protein GCM10007885_24580 [Methylobacterium gnaphalii]
MANPPRRKPRSLSEFDPSQGNGGTQPPAPPPPPPPEPPDEEGVPVSYLVKESDRDMLKMLCIQKKLSGQQLHHLAINYWLASEGLPPLQPQTANRASGGRKRR